MFKRSNTPVINLQAISKTSCTKEPCSWNHVICLYHHLISVLDHNHITYIKSCSGVYFSLPNFQIDVFRLVCVTNIVVKYLYYKNKHVVCKSMLATYAGFKTDLACLFVTCLIC